MARLKNDKWEFIEIPVHNILNHLVIMNANLIYGLDNTSCLWRFAESNWNKELSGLKIRSIFKLNSEVMFALSGSSLYKLSNGIWSIHSKSEVLTQIFDLSILSDSLIWGCGNNGKIVLFQNGKWTNINSPTSEKLNSIYMPDGKTGWIAGNNGTLLIYTNIEIPPINSKPGFRKFNFHGITKKLVDQYGVIISDFTNDGLPDIISLSVFDKNHYFVNKGNTFSELSEYYNLTNENSKRDIRSFNLNIGITGGDIDNDGDNDIYITSLDDKNSLFENYNNGNFRLLKSGNISPGNLNERSNSASFSDIDNDGDLDIFVTNENSTNRLLLNLGNGSFEDVTNSVGLKTEFGGTGCCLADIDNDNDIDIAVTVWGGKNLLFRNKLSETHILEFDEISKEANIGGNSWSKSNGIVFFDSDNDGDLDLFITNRKTSNKYYLNDGKGIFNDVTKEYIGIDSLLSYGVLAEDFDNDGDRDLYISNVGDNSFFENVGKGKFVEQTRKFKLEQGGYSTGSAAGDLDNDGDIDIYSASFAGESSLLFYNQINNRNFIVIKLIGVKSNRNAIGAKIYLYKAGHINDQKYLISFHEIYSGSGYGSASDLVFHSGVEKEDFVDIKVIFPASKIVREILNKKKGQPIIVKEIEGTLGSINLMIRDFLTFIADRETQIEIFKFILVLIIIAAAIYIGRKKYNLPLAVSILILFVFPVFYGLHMHFLRFSGLLLSTILPFTGILLSLGLVFIYFQKKSIQKSAEEERMKIRERISRDLHDDVASTLSSISIYNESLRRMVDTDDTKIESIFFKINTLIVDAAESVSNIVWSVTPTHDTLESLIKRIKYLLKDKFHQTNIKLNFAVDINHPLLQLPGAVRNNIYLILKEASQNIIKHSQANLVECKLIEEDGNLLIVLNDNGIGFTGKRNENPVSGNGLLNMKKRAKQISAEFEVFSEAGKGTKIILKTKNNTDALL